MLLGTSQYLYQCKDCLVLPSYHLVSMAGSLWTWEGREDKTIIGVQFISWSYPARNWSWRLVAADKEFLYIWNVLYIQEAQTRKGALVREKESECTINIYWMLSTYFLIWSSEQCNKTEMINLFLWMRKPKSPVLVPSYEWGQSMNQNASDPSNSIRNRKGGFSPFAFLVLCALSIQSGDG